MRLAAIIAMAASVASAQQDAGLVWHGLLPGLSASNAIHNAIDGRVGNTRGPIVETTGGVVSNDTTTAAWVGWGTNYNPMATADQLTFVGWITRGSGVNWGLCGNAPSVGGSNMAYLANIAPGTRTYLYVQATASNYRFIDVSGHTPTLTTNWMQIGATWAGGTNFALYVNGARHITGVGAAGTPSNTLAACLNQEWRVGSFANAVFPIVSSNALWNWRVYNRALSEREIAHLRMMDRRLLP